MVRCCFLILFIVSFSLCLFGQGEKLTAPIKWERYKISDKNISLLFPKMPIRIDSINICKSRELKEYGVYADGVGYIFTIVTKNKPLISFDNCEKKEDFTEKSFENNIAEVKLKLTGEIKETKVKTNDYELTKLSWAKNNNRWFLNDYKNKTWYEFSVYGADETKKDVKDFIESLKLNKNPQGIEISSGSPFVLGDETVNTKPEKGDNPITSDLRILTKPKPGYTDMARKNNVFGIVRLKVTFNANGSVSSITTMSGLPDGLTEQAIAAAKKIVFIPKTFENVRMTVTKVVEYSFTIY